MPKCARPKHLLWALLLLKVYGTETLLSSFVGGVTEKTYRKWAWCFIDGIAKLESAVVSQLHPMQQFPPTIHSHACLNFVTTLYRFYGKILNDCLVSVDGTDFRIIEPKPFDKGWYSHKFHGPALRCEITLCIRTGDIVWVSGPFPAGEWTDLKIFRNELKHFLGPGERVEADKGYRGDFPLCVKTHCPGEASEKKYMRRLVLARHEHVNGRLKNFAILRERFRHEKDMMNKHGNAFRAIIVLTQLSFYDGAPLNPVDYVDF
jgi:hypothetical protein